MRAIEPQALPEERHVFILIWSDLARILNDDPSGTMTIKSEPP